MFVNINGNQYKFVPKCVNNPETVQKHKLIMKNDTYEKYEALAEIRGELIAVDESSSEKNKTHRLVKETYEEYLKTLLKRNPEKDRWIYNIIYGTAEQHLILYRDNACIVIPTYMWDRKSIDKLHILCMPVDVTLQSIRSLNATHINLLNHMKYITLNVIKNLYGLDESRLKIYIHYEPSTYHLHVHFVNLAHKDSNSSVEYSHELNTVIYNLSLYSDYYKGFLLKRV